MIKLFACDLDGTLLNEEHTSDEIILSGIDQVIEKGRYFTIATGRHLHEDQTSEEFGNRKIYTICMNGALILDENRNPIYQKTLSKEFVKGIMEAFPEVDFEFIGMNHTFIRFSKEEHFANFKRRSIWNRVVDENKIQRFIRDCIFDQSVEDILKQDIYKLNTRVDEQTSQRLSEYLQQHSDEVVNAPFAEGVFEITDKSVNKGEAVKRLADWLGISEDEVAVYGDGGNDLQMLARFAHSYAMSNGTDEAKKAANEVIGDCKDHAVIKHILEIIHQ